LSGSHFLIAGFNLECEIPRMKSEKIFMRRAIELARTGMNQGAGGPFAAVVVKDGTIVGEGWNRVLANRCCRTSAIIDPDTQKKSPKTLA